MLEIRNESNRSLWVSACISKLTGRLYIHIGTERKQVHGKPVKVLPYDYEVIEPVVTES